MATETGARLAQAIRSTVQELREQCAAVGEAQAAQAPAGRWTPKEILSHLIGPKPGALQSVLDRFLTSEVPLIEIHPEQIYATPERQALSFAQLVELFTQEYEGIAQFAEGLTEAQLARTAQVPLFKDSPLGEYPTLAAFLGGLGQYHVHMHAEHLTEVLAGKPAQ